MKDEIGVRETEDRPFYTVLTNERFGLQPYIKMHIMYKDSLLISSMDQNTLTSICNYLNDAYELGFSKGERKATAQANKELRAIVDKIDGIAGRV